jgi:hypothetical protein
MEQKNQRREREEKLGRDYYVRALHERKSGRQGPTMVRRAMVKAQPGARGKETNPATGQDGPCCDRCPVP